MSLGRRVERRGSFCRVENWSFQCAASVLRVGEQRRKGSSGHPRKAHWPFLYLLMLPLAQVCCGFSVPGLNHSGWKVFSLLLEVENTASTASLFCHLNSQKL